MRSQDGVRAYLNFLVASPILERGRNRRWYEVTLEVSIGVLVFLVIALPYVLRNIKFGLMAAIVGLWLLHVVRFRRIGLSKRVLWWWAGLTLVAGFGATTGLLRGGNMQGIKEGILYTALYPTCQLIIVGAAELCAGWKGAKVGLILGALLSSVLIVVQFMHVAGLIVPGYESLIRLFPQGALANNPNRNFGLTGSNSFLPRSVGYHLMLGPYLLLLGVQAWDKRRRAFAFLLWVAEGSVVAITARRAIWVAVSVALLIAWVLVRKRATPGDGKGLTEGIGVACVIVTMALAAPSILRMMGYTHMDTPLVHVLGNRPAAQTEDSNSVRLAQLKGLVRGIAKRPFLGHGFGAAAAGLGNRGATPWRYELWYLGLAYHLGLLALAVLMSMPVAAWWQRFRRWTAGNPMVSNDWIPLAVAATAWPLAGTNPYLATFGGQFILFVPLWGWLSAQGAASRDVRNVV